jgi:hypothetical protein
MLVSLWRGYSAECAMRWKLRSRLKEIILLDFAQSNNWHGFTMWQAGAGVKGDRQSAQRMRKVMA